MRKQSLGEYNTQVMTISLEQVESVGRLAYLTLLNEEKTTLPERFGAILDYISELQTINTEGVKETMQITGQHDELAPDLAQPSIVTREELLERAPQFENGYVKVKSVFDGN